MKRVVWIVTLLVVASSLSGCCCCWTSGAQAPSKVARNIGASSLQRETQQIELDGTERVEATIRFGGGELDIKRLEVEAGDAPLLQADFSYNIEGLSPEIDHSVQAGVAKLQIRQKTEATNLERLTTNVRNEWELALCDCVPMSLDLDVGAASGRLELGGLRIERLDLTTGAADLEVSFRQANPERLRSMHILCGAARLDLIELGNANLDELTFDGGLGTYTFDLTGEWQRSANVYVQAGASRVQLRVPRDVGVRVCAGDLRRAHFDGLEREGDCYVNPLYGQSDIALDISLDLGLGRLDIEQVR